MLNGFLTAGKISASVSVSANVYDMPSFGNK